MLLFASAFLLPVCMPSLFAQPGELAQLKISEKDYLRYKNHFFEGTRYKMLGDIDQAIEEFLKCREILPQSAATHYELACLHYLKGDYITALMFSKQAVKFNPDIIYYHLQLITMYNENGMPAEAASVYKKLLKSFPERSDLRLEYA
ncbi:MAG: hypothetical protein KJ607_03245, partial [Bacteroidetes bacterium]|nr:hypothetical protein [Bacteroidota bacterium]